MSTQLEQAHNTEKESPQQAAEIYKAVLHADSSSDVGTAERETALLSLAALYERMQDASSLTELINNAQGFLVSVPRAKSSRLVRLLVDRFNGIHGGIQPQINTCQGMIEWSKSENREYLRQALETRLVSLYLDSHKYTDSLNLIAKLLAELKKLDDKMQLVEVHLLESRTFMALKNLPKSRAALTSARTAANSIYTPPPLQAQLDLQSGILHSEEGDFKTAYSYFFETMEGIAVYANPKGPTKGEASDDIAAARANFEQQQLDAFAYMVLCKIMTQQPDEIPSLFASGKTASKFREHLVIVALQAVAKAQKQRSLADFEKALSVYRNELQSNEIIRSHLAALYDTLLEQDLARLIEPYSRVEIAHVSKLIGLPIRVVENKLSQMILDKVLHGILDQGSGCLVIFPEPKADSTYKTTLETMKSLGNVVDSLYNKAATLGTVADYIWRNASPASVGYVCHNSYTKVIVVSFRGTADANDWVQDSAFSFEPWPSHFPGSMVHHGFLNAYLSVAGNVTRKIIELAKRYPLYKIVFTGHSLGGAESVLCAVDVLKQFPQIKDRVHIYTYGMPRIGNQAWASAVDGLGIQIYRIVYENDLVPHIPFQWLGYQHFSNEVWIHNNRTVFCGPEGESPQCSSGVSLVDYSVPDHSQYTHSSWKFVF
ncbi:26S proteasome regulatory subunit rpn6 [Coemansia sp. RSA 1939]|nr:26S proteasome regulatory subunit rpn6 [Coemansia sp. RSA 1939]